MEIFCTLGPSSLNKNFLNFSNNKVSLLRLNMSHVKLNQLEATIKFVKKYSTVPLCIDTEGAQIRTRAKKKILKKNNTLIINKKLGSFTLYPYEVFNKLKKNDILDIGFKDLKVKIFKIKLDKIYCKVTSSGILENSQGVHLTNRKIKLNFVTEKDKQAIKIARKLKIKYFALSFTNSYEDILKFDALFKNEKKIFKLETKNAIRNINKILNAGQRFLIDRGDLSKDTSIEIIPLIQKNILNLAKAKKKKIYVATNFLESMLLNKYPTRGEANDIYNTLDSGAAGLVLAAETAIGSHPKECIIFIKKIIKIFKKNKSVHAKNFYQNI